MMSPTGPKDLQVNNLQDLQVYVSACAPTCQGARSGPQSMGSLGIHEAPIGNGLYVRVNSSIFRVCVCVCVCVCTQLERTERWA